MKLARIQVNGEVPVIGVLEGEQLRLTRESDALAVMAENNIAFTGERIPWEPLLAGKDERFRLLAPVDPPEVWACGFTYQRGPQFQRSEMLPSGPAYTDAIAAGRPEIFFKTTGFRVVGPNDPVGIRGDSRYTAVEAELCLILDEAARPVLFTAGNDVSAWDIEAENPLWLAQGKTFEACCPLGPLAVTREEIPGDARVRCRVLRGPQVLFDDSVPLSDLKYSFEDLANFAAVYNPLPKGAVLMTGTAVIRPGSQGLAEGDVVETIIDGIGTLRNVGKLLDAKFPVHDYDFSRFTGGL
jgi:2-dehydro-3-deoxy-D-arabinonate dehydratase